MKKFFVIIISFIPTLLFPSQFQTMGISPNQKIYFVNRDVSNVKAYCLEF